MSKFYTNLYPSITCVDNAYDALRKTRLGKEKYKAAAVRFTEHETTSMNELIDDLKTQTYTVGEYNHFTVLEPKEREIYAPCFRDKIVQHMIHSVLKHVYWPCFIHDSYACIEGKGTHSCVERIGHFIRKAKWQYGDAAFIVKLDIRKFFYSIDREILKALLRKKIKCSKALWLLDAVIDSSPAPGRGLPLGNLTSQLFANIYLNEFDQYAKRELGIKYYIRYADDAIAIVETRSRANYVLKKAHEFMEKRLNLELNARKSKIFPLAQGVNAIGFKHQPTHRLLRNDCKKKIKRKLRAMPRLHAEGKISRAKIGQIVDSWYGHARYANSLSFIRGLERRFDFLYYRNNRLLIHI